jgi:hypothetical protein
MTEAGEIAHAAFRGTVGAMAMSGLRRFAADLGLIERSPPQQVMHETRLRRFLPDDREQAAEELVHWVVGAVGGAIYGALPAAVRRAPWAGPAYGLGIWVSFEGGVAPALGLSHHRVHGVAARLVLIADHTVYGLVLTELRERPRR